MQLVLRGRSRAVKEIKMARAQCNTIYLKLLKVGAVIIKNTRRIRFLLSSAYPYKKTISH
ncbi:transposase [Nitrospinaceae bacterium]|nr:transposase [Nitrospinaceae bacterium]